tara:strand:- start:1528 stop:1707 length:180 start_codon:yes stop_codon:yes gene_type:complete
MKKEIGTVVWKSYTNYLLLGIVRETKVEKGWRMLRIDWDLPHGNFVVDEWQRSSNVGCR